jgi:carbamoyltransferase
MAYEEKEVLDAIRGSATDIIAEPMTKDDLVDSVAELLSAGAIVAWYQGSAESGPRALGHRSILCNPKLPRMKDTLNRRVKHRESFRPFAPSVLDEAKSDYFILEGSSPYMLRVVQVKHDCRKLIPAVVHVDGTARPQTVGNDSETELFRDLIRAFGERTGIPMLLNTSFNTRGEPIVETPRDAIRTFMSAKIDYLVMASYLIRKRSQNACSHQ